MLQLKNILKDYSSGDSLVHALKGVSIEFRKSEFVAILGQSGCGKTTMLNIIGGLDRYTDGDLIINKKSTKEYKDADWDTYRNHSVGFIFQSYNLIPHQSVLANVELALTLSGVPKAERKRRAVEALEKVGLGDQIHKKPNQMSGGQMQRVAIARALVNDPDILLADEPTGALDSETSIQIMDILKSISDEKLIIMVTHNPELAEQYASRTVRLLDGNVVSDSNPYDSSVEEKPESDVSDASDNKKKIKKEKKVKKEKKPSMSFFTALSLSLNNLMTKKGRTFLTSFAGSIGIIGIALILALSTGIQTYINDVQEETLSSYPISIYTHETDLSGLLTSFADSDSANAHEKDAVYSNTMVYQFMNALNEETTENNLKDFKVFLDKEMEKSISTTELYDYAKAIEYSYDVPINAYTTDSSGKYVKADFMGMFEEMVSVMTQSADSAESAGTASSMTSLMGSSSSSTMKIWSEILPGENGDLVSDMISDQYDLVYGSWPTSANEVVLILTQNNEVSDFTLYSLGLKDMADMMAIMESASKGEQVNTEIESWSYKEICDIRFKLITNSDYYSDTDKDGVWTEYDEETLQNVIIKNSPMELKISGIIRPKEDANFAIMTGSLGYTRELTEYIIDKTNSSDIVKAQQDSANENFDVFTGNPFYISKDMTDAEKVEEFKAYCASLSSDAKKTLYGEMISALTDEELEAAVNAEMSKYTTREEKEAALIQGYVAATGMDAEVISGMIDFSSYDDAQIDSTLREAIVMIIESQTNGDAIIEEIITTPSQEEIDAVIAEQIEAVRQMGNLPDNTPEDVLTLTWIAYSYSQAVGLPSDVLYEYLATLSAEEIDTIANKIAAEYYDAAGLYEETAESKINASFEEYISSLTEQELEEAYDNYIGMSESTLEDNLVKLGVADVSNPSAINIYAATFEAKDQIADIIDGYNKGTTEENEIKYTDYVAILMSSISTVINAISYVLIAFVSISLVVSSIMIGIITYISVLERTKEIGILRSIGASKKDVSRVFNAETVIEGFASGMIGIIFTLLLCIPINIIIQALTNIDNIKAHLPVAGAVALVIISMVLTVVAGLFPAKVAAKKDPVEALRSE